MVVVVGITSRDLHIVFRFEKRGEPLGGKKSNANIMSFMVRILLELTMVLLQNIKTEIPDLQKHLYSPKAKKTYFFSFYATKDLGLPI